MRSVIANYYGLDYTIYDDGTIIGPERGKLKQRENEDGYMEVTLGNLKNRHSRVKVHRIIAEQFVPNPNNLPEVNHKDYNRKNNNADNLEWCSHEYNVKYSSEAGRHNKPVGEKNGRAKITWEIANKIREMANSGYKRSEISKELDVPYGIVINVINNVTWVI